MAIRTTLRRLWLAAALRRAAHRCVSLQRERAAIEREYQGHLALLEQERARASLAYSRLLAAITSTS